MASETHTPGPWFVTRAKLAVDDAFDYAISAEGATARRRAFYIMKSTAALVAATYAAFLFEGSKL